MIDEKKLIKELEDWKNESPDTEEESIWNNSINQCIREVKRQPKVGEWTPIEEGLPENNRDYPYYEINLVTIENGDVCLGVYRHSDKEWLTRMSEGETVYSNKHKVIAWKPRPEPYRKEDNK